MQNQHKTTGALQLIKAQPRKACRPIGWQAFGTEGLKLQLAPRQQHSMWKVTSLCNPSAFPPDQVPTARNAIFPWNCAALRLCRVRDTSTGRSSLSARMDCSACASFLSSKPNHRVAHQPVLHTI